ncbi:MAG: hypothetical protein A2Z97_06615 [Bdellovibrionales bacterium GWB1_52_6]|nr:MAG: hypothetical protein A2Z97_06615 [Bdellovibrionales bacterium GWB1_52_6]OFZ05518.1 MAG: hypothetical protein A2X97_11630 [Bdellovibrionales bacterium GWA1_52_35]HCM39116.1 hypothetical protein [Bdellovibrionales bacterium]
MSYVARVHLSLAFFLISSLGLGAEVVSKPPKDGLWTEIRRAPLSKGETAIRNLMITERYFPVIEKDEKLVVVFKAKFHDQDFTLLHDREQIKTETNTGVFHLDFPLTGERTRLVLNAVTPQGKIQTSTFNLVFSGYNAFMQKLAEERKLRTSLQKRLSWNLGMGLSSIDYLQSDSNPMKQTALTAKLSWSGMLKPPRWDIGITSFLTAATLTNTRKDVNVRFFGVNGRVGYILPYVTEPWKLSLMAGYYYTTMFVSGTQLGYRHLQGPMAFPVLRRSLKDGSSISGYFKFSPMSDKFSLLSLSSHEKAAGVSYSRALSARYGWGLSLDVSQFLFSSARTTLKYSTYTAGAGLSF